MLMMMMIILHFYMAIRPLWPQSCLLNLSWVEFELIYLLEKILAGLSTTEKELTKEIQYNVCLKIDYSQKSTDVNDRVDGHTCDMRKAAPPRPHPTSSTCCPGSRDSFLKTSCSHRHTNLSRQYNNITTIQWYYYYNNIIITR